ncbi:MAG: hypothetical protein JST11_01950 [Acidobacteria bacterium]|nr:hypothetical protein [Acidobacteriota bacterium]
MQDGSFSLRRETARVEVARSGYMAYCEGSYVIVCRMTPGKMWKAVTDTLARSADPEPR